MVFTNNLSENPPPRRFCIGFFGMIRIPVTRHDFQNFMRLLPANSTVDVFITCCGRPTEMDENIKLEFTVQSSVSSSVIGKWVVDIVCSFCSFSCISIKSLIVSWHSWHIAPSILHTLI